uniref:Uncharacterized protein n=1 Tax=Arundo donax TaxID=35708 RepID=A0A0A9CE16_ARUDO
MWCVSEVLYPHRFFHSHFLS